MVPGLYIQATGSGVGSYEADITKWNEQRRIPAMRHYFNHMHTYHISYAAFPEGYIRGRRYMPEQGGLTGTGMFPDYYPPAELFAPGVRHHFTVIKRGQELFMRIERPDLVFYCHFTNPELPTVTEGRIGLWHMFTRSALYRDFRISRLRD